MQGFIYPGAKGVKNPCSNLWKETSTYYILQGLFSVILFLFAGCAETPGAEHIELTAADGREIKLPDSLYFSAIADITSGAAGNLYVIESENYVLTKFSSNGTLKERFARAGEGPGEFSSAPESICVAEGKVYVAVRSKRQIPVYGQNLSFQGNFKLPEGAAFPYSISCGRDGYMTVGSMEPRYRTNFMRYPLEGGVPVRLSLEKARGSMYWDRIVVAAHDDGTTVAAYRQLPFLEIVNPEATTRFALRMQPLREVENLPKVKKRTLKEQVRMFQKQRPTKSVVWDVAMDRQKKIYVLGADYSEIPHRQVYVYDLEGQHQSTITLPQAAGQIHVRNGVLYAAEDGQTTLAAYKLP